MISYKTWKLLQENMGQTNLGVKSPNIIGITESPLFGMMKKKKGFPGAEEGPPAPDMGGADATDDEDMGDDDHDHDDDGEDMGDEEGGDEDMDHDDDEEGHDHDDDGEDMGDDEGGDEESGDMGDMGGDMGAPPMKKKKPPMDMGAKPPMMMRSYMKKESKDAVDEKSKKQNSANDADMLKMKEKGGKKCCSNCNKMQKEDNEFLSKLRSMTGGTKFAVDDEGYWVPMDEDALIAPDNNNSSEPGPGEVGYAPAQKVGSNFQEWAKNHVTKTRK
jgi:hypothetical protein